MPADRVKPSGRPSLRAERAAVTRRRIADAARHALARDGYGATTLQAIAEEAGVAVQTVYAVYGSKAGILRELREAIVSQPEADARVREAMQATTPRQCLELLARSVRLRWEAGSDVIRISREAAATDATLRDELGLVYRRRRRGLATVVATLEGALAKGLDLERAEAIVNALTLPELYEELVGAQGWTADAYETWLAGTLKRQLL